MSEYPQRVGRELLRGLLMELWGAGEDEDEGLLESAGATQLSGLGPVFGHGFPQSHCTPQRSGVVLLFHTVDSLRALRH